MSTLKAEELQVVAAPESELTQIPAEVSKLADQLIAQLESQYKSALDEALARPRTETADPESWWNIWALGPIQLPIPNPFNFGFLPIVSHQVMKVGEWAAIATLRVYNPFPILSGPLSPSQVLTTFNIPTEIRYQTCNQTTCSLGPANLNVLHFGTSGGSPIDLLVFQATTPGVYEMNITERILGAAPPHVNSPQFGAFARAVFDFDPETFFTFNVSGVPGIQFDAPIRFMVYP